MVQTPIISPSMAELLVMAIESRLADLHTGLPAKVVSFNAPKQSCSVQPLLIRLIVDESGKNVEEPLPQIDNVPVRYFSAGGWSIIFPLKPGNIVYLAFAERSIDTWLEAEPGASVVPEQSRKHDLSDAIAVPGLRPRTDPIPDLAALGDNMRIGRDGGDPAIVLKPDGTIETGEGATEAQVLGNKLNTNLSAITVPTAFGPSGPPINAATFGQHLSSKAKVK